MTTLLEQALAHVRTLPPEFQDRIAEIVFELADRELPAYRLGSEEAAAMD